MASRTAEAKTGSSPRVRGTVLLMVRRSASLRFIPACAGNSASDGASLGQFAVHPRVCGEQLLENCHIGAKSGSSPRVRGTVARKLSHWGKIRFIPACAGNRLSKEHRLGDVPVHPRVCGEQASGLSQHRATCGSSPRVRGTDRKIGGSKLSRRFIPACAGNSGCISCYQPLVTVHPRVCGEQDVKPDSFSGETGSSPRVRGTG